MKQEEREKVIALRKQGLSYKQILQEVKVSKGTLSLWCQGIDCPNVTPQPSKEGRERGAKLLKEWWETRRQEVRDNYNPPLQDAMFMFGLGLYWGEGCKVGNSEVILTNMDVNVVLHFKKWIENFFPEEFDGWGLELSLHDQDEADAKLYWSTKLNLPIEGIKCRRVKPRGVPYSGPKRWGIAQLRLVSGKNSSVWKIRQKIQKAIDTMGPSFSG